MAGNRTVLQEWHVLMDGASYAGISNRVSPPEIQAEVARYRAAGMDASVPVITGTGEMMFSFDLQDFSAAAARRFGQTGTDVDLELRTSLEPHVGAGRTQVHRGSGLLTTVSNGELTADDGTNIPIMSLTVDCTFYSWHEGGQEIMYIDVPNMIRRIGGVDQLAARRAALGL